MEPTHLKTSFSTNFTCATNVQFYCLHGTNQLVTMPPAAGIRGIPYRFSMDNGYGSFVLTNSGDGAKFRDGVSLSYTNIGINEVGFISDGTNYWLASKGKTIFPSASWSLTNTLTLTQDILTNIPFTNLEFNNSQGIGLLTNGFGVLSNIAVTNAGTYLVTYSAVVKGSGASSGVSIWLRQGDVGSVLSDVPRSRTDQAFSAASAQQCITVNYFVSVGQTPQAFALCIASHDASPPTVVSAAANPILGHEIETTHLDSLPLRRRRVALVDSGGRRRS